MKIEVNEQTIDNFFKTGANIFVIPDYQRPYSWKKEQLEDLWSDIDTLDEDDTHFIGSFVLISQMNRPGEYNKLEVVDGQQRLTTLSIFIKVLLDYYKNIDKDDVVNELEEYLYTKVIQQEKQIKLQLGKIDRESYEKCLEGSLKEIEGTNIYNTYMFFKDKIASVENPYDFAKLIIYGLNFVVIYTDSDKSAYRLFETLNDRGLDLSAVDLIKNYLLKVVSEKNLDIEQVKNMWENIMQNLDDIDKVRFFRHYLLSSKIYETRGKITKDGLYDKFCNAVEEVDDIVRFVDDIKEKSLLYAKIANSEIDKFDSNRNETINKHLRNISAIKATTSYTFLLRLFVEEENTESIVDILKLVEVFAVRRNIVGVSTADLDLIYNAVALDAFKNEFDAYEFVKKHFTDNTPTDDEFLHKFTTATFQQNDQTKYILDKLAMEGFGVGQGGIIVGNSYSVHIEHIAPQTMKNTSDWNGFGELTADERKKKISNIGNLTLLEKKPNIQASNSTFEEKKNFYTSDSTDIKMTQELVSYDNWGIEQIEQRSEKLAKMAIKVWKY